MPAISEIQETKVSGFFLLFFFFFLHKHNILGMHASIGMKFGKHIGQPKAIISTKFCEDPTNILVAINNYSRKQRSICWLAYRLNY